MLAATVLVPTAVSGPVAAGGLVEVDPGLKLAVIGDSGVGPDATAVLQLIANEGADMVLHLGDFDYIDDPAAFESSIDAVLGSDFPYFVTVGNHDLPDWSTYQANFLDRLSRVAGASCTGEYGVNAACTYRGLSFVLSGVGTLGGGHDAYLQNQLASDQHRWRVCAWHKNQAAMQVGSKADEVGWAAYETCRQYGAMILTGHEHSYSRTKTLVDMADQIVDPDWPSASEVRVAPGATFSAVSGLGGRPVRPQVRCLPSTPPYGCNGEWASISTSTNGGTFGALFIEFNVDGDPTKGRGTFKDVNGQVVDSFDITSQNTVSTSITTSFRNGADGYSSTEDTMLKQGAPSTSFGNLASLEWDTVAGDASNQPKYSVLRFGDLFGSGPGQIPTDATIETASLNLEVFDAGHSATLHQVAVDWNEATTYDGFGPDPGVDSADHGPSLGVVPAAAGSHSLNVISSLNEWLSGAAPNHGWIVIPGGSNGVDARSSEYATVASRPTLTVTYSTSSDPDPPTPGPHGLDLGSGSGHVTFGTATKLGLAEFTIETWFRRDGTGGTASSGSGGVTAVPLITKGRGEADGDSRDMNYFLGIGASGTLVADFEDSSSGGNHPVIGTTIVSGGWHHAAASYDGTTWRLYLDGQLDATAAVGASPRSDSVQHAGLGTAMTSSGATQGHFDGVLDEVRIWDHARTGTEIATAINDEIASAAGLVARWALDEGSGSNVGDSVSPPAAGIIVGSGITWAPGAPFDITIDTNLVPDAPTLVAPVDGATGLPSSVDLQVTTGDGDGDLVTTTFFGRKVDTAPGGDFTIVVIPDTQHYVDADDARAEIYSGQTQWIADNAAALNVAFVSHLGDITQSYDADPVEWQRADAAMDILDNAGIPNNLAPGNHDLGLGGTTSTLYDLWFPPERYDLPQNPWYGGWLGEESGQINRLNKDNYELFSAAGIDFLIIHLEIDMPTYAVAWASEIISRHPRRQVIISTHAFLTAGGSRPTSTVTGRADGLSSAQVWDQLISPNCTIFLVVNGHYSGEGRRASTNSCGEPVHQIVSDYQSRPNGGDGWLRYYTFRPATNEIDAFTYSTRLSTFETDSSSQFTLTYDMTDLGGFAEVGETTTTAGAVASATWAALDNDAVYEWFATASDGQAVTSGPTWSLATVVTNGAPTFDQDLGDRSDDEGSVIGLASAASDPDGDVLGYTAVGLPAGLVIDPASGTISGTISSGTADLSPYAVQVTVSDGFRSDVDAFTWNVANPDAPTEVSFRDGLGQYTGTIDTMIKQGASSSSFGGLSSIEWDTVASDGANLPKYALIAFDDIFGAGAGQLPLGSTIESATLDLTIFNPGNSADVHESAVAWSESTTFDQFGPAAGVQASDLRSFVGSIAGSTGARSIDVSSSVAAWSAGEPNYGWVIVPTGQDGVDVRASEYGVIADRPVLHVVYSDGDGPPPPNGAPVAADDGPFDIAHGGSLSVPAPGVLSNDSDPDTGDVLTAVLESDPSNASSFLLNDDGSFIYVHDGVAAGPDSFTYRAFDGTDPSNVVTVNIDIDAPPPPPPPNDPLLYLSVKGNSTVNGQVNVANEDIVLVTADGAELYFDGSDVGLSGLRIDAFSLFDDGDIVMSFSASGSIAGIPGTVDDSDLVRFSPSSLGTDTAGAFVLYFDGSDVGLSSGGEDVDAVDVLDDGRIILSTTGNVSAAGVSARDEDLLVFVPTTLGTTTAGTFSMYFDGSDVGVGGEDVDALGSASSLTAMSFKNDWTADGLVGRDEDIVDFGIVSPGTTTVGTFIAIRYDGSVHGIGGTDIGGIHLP